MKNFEEIIESVITSNINPALWNGRKLDEKVRKTLSNISNEFLNTLKINLKPKDIILTGSCANYNWHAKSDIDLHFVIDFKSVKNIDSSVLSDYLYESGVLWNEHHTNIKIHGFPVEIYASHDSAEKIPYSSGVYSIVKNKWIKEPILMKNHDEGEIRIKAKPWRKRISALIDKANVESNNKKMADELQSLLSDLKRYRGKGLVSKGEYSVENLVFKNLRKDNLLGKLIATARQVYDNSLSLSEARIELAEIMSWA